MNFKHALGILRTHAIVRLLTPDAVITQALQRTLLSCQKELTRDVDDYLVCLIEHVRELRNLQVSLNLIALSSYHRI